MTRQRVALDFTTLDTVAPASGQHRYVVDLVRGLAARELPYEFVLLGSRPEPPAELADVCGAGGAWRYHRWVAPARLGAAYLRHGGLAGLLAGMRVQLLHALHGFVPLFARCPVVPTVYDLMFELFPEYAPAVRSRPYRLLRWATQRRARTIIAISQTTAGDLERLWDIPADRVRVVPLGSSLAERGAALPRGVVEPTLIASPFNLEPRKNVAALLRAMPAVLAAVPDARLHLHGRAAVTPERERAFDALVAELGIGHAVVKSGVLDDAGLSALYGRAAVYAFPSLYEGFGLPLLEAMAHGAAVVAIRAAAMAEVVGDAGLLVPSGAAADIAAGVVRLLRDAAARTALGAAARARAATFTVDRMVDGTLDAYAAALARRSR